MSSLHVTIYLAEFPGRVSAKCMASNYTGQHTNTEKKRIHILPLRRIQIHHPSIRAIEVSRTYGHNDRN
jgi:hypothetical protein